MKKLKKSFLSKKSKGSSVLKKDRSLTPSHYSQYGKGGKISSKKLNFSPSPDTRDDRDKSRGSLKKRSHISKLTKNMIGKGSPKHNRATTNGSDKG